QGHDPQAGTDRVCTTGNQPDLDADPSDQHPGDQYLGQSGTQHRRGGIPGRLGTGATMVVLGRATDRWRRGRPDLSRLAGRQESLNGWLYTTARIVSMRGAVVI